MNNNDFLTNIRACTELGKCLQSTLGPKGMDKLLMDEQENILVSNDGATLMSHLRIQHPAALLLSKVSKSQDDQVGDGTTSVTLLSAEFLKQAQSLVVEKNVHASVIIEGYRRCLKVALEQLSKYSVPIDFTTDETLVQIAKTTIGSKVVNTDSDHFATLAVQLANQLNDASLRNNAKISLNNYYVAKLPGKSIAQSEALDGCVVRKSVPPNCPQRIENAKILVCKMERLASARTKFHNAQISVSSHSEAQDMNAYEHEYITGICDTIIKCGVNVVFNSGCGIHAVAQQYLYKNNVMCVGHVDFKTAQMISVVTNCPIRSQITEQDVTKAFGFAKCVEHVALAEESYLKISGCMHSNTAWCSVILRAPTATVLDECERSMHDAMCILTAAINSKRYIGGGGCMYIHIAQYLRSIMMKEESVMQLVIEAYANALESIPTRLAQNAGLQSSQLISEMRSKHTQFITESESHPNKYPFMALNLKKGTVSDAVTEIGVIEPISVMKHVLSKSLDAAEMIIRIDRNIFLKPDASFAELGL